MNKEGIGNRVDCEVILRAVAHPLLVLDAETRVLIANQAFLTAFHLTETDVDGKPLRERDEAPWNTADFRRLLGEVFAGRRGAAEIQVEDDFPRVGRRVFVIKGDVLPEDCGDGPLILLSIQDVTTAVFAMRRTEMASAELEKSNRVLSEFASFAAHDLQAPVNRISKFSELLASEMNFGSKERAAHHVTTIQNQARQMSILIRDLLRLGRVAAAADDVETVQLSSVLSEVLENLDEPINATGATFQFGDLPVVRGRRTQLRQLFINLVDNAIRYRKAGETPVVRLEARPCAIGVEILVTDNGIGFPADQAEEIFKPFRRLEDNRGPGSGLGLSICRRIIEALGGNIRAESEPGVGTTFIVQFPAPVLK